MKHTVAILLTSAFASVSAFSQATTLALHTGYNDPTTEGFMMLGGGIAREFPITNDMGHNAWLISPNRSMVAYTQALPLFSGLDWTYSIVLKVMNAGEDNAYFAKVGTGSENFTLYFGTTNGNIPTVAVQGTSTAGVFNVNGGSLLHNSYQLVYTSAADSASLWVNGSELATEIIGQQSSASAGQAAWGSFLDENYSQASWSGVSLAIPEPSASALFFLGGFGLFTVHRRRSNFQTK